MNDLKYVTNKTGKPVEVILSIKKYKELIDIKNTYEERLKIFSSIKAGAEEVMKDRINNNLTQELAGFIDELEDRTH